MQHAAALAALRSAERCTNVGASAGGSGHAQRACAARSAWGPVNVYTNVFLTKAQAFLPGADAAARKLLLRWTIALPYLLRSHLLDYESGADSLENVLTATEVRCRVRPARWMPLCVCDTTMPRRPGVSPPSAALALDWAAANAAASRSAPARSTPQRGSHCMMLLVRPSAAPCGGLRTATAACRSSGCEVACQSMAQRCRRSISRSSQ